MLASNIRAIVLDVLIPCLPRSAVPGPGRPHGHRPAPHLALWLPVMGHWPNVSQAEHGDRVGVEEAC
jgi:hypothetical protein